MEFVTNEKLTIVGAAGMIGSNMAQTAIMMGLTPNICLYDPYAPDLLKGNAAIAEEFGKNVKEYCPDVKHIVVIFNPADITGLITLQPG